MCDDESLDYKKQKLLAMTWNINEKVAKLLIA